MLPSILLPVFTLAFCSLSRAQPTIYEYPFAINEPGRRYTGWEAYDPTELKEPPLPAQRPILDFPITLDTSGNPQAGHRVLGSFLGISIELSLAEPIIGPNAWVFQLHRVLACSLRDSSYLRPQFLNLMSTVAERGGPPVLRCGGNTQEKAGLVDSLPDGASMAKFAIGPTGFTNTPTLSYTIDILKALRATSDLLGIKWFIGIPMNTTDPPRIDVVVKGEDVMGDYLWGWQLGNEPDLYVSHHYRNESYTQADYLVEFQRVLDAIDAHPTIKVKNNIGGPGTCCIWRLTDMLHQYQFMDRFNSHLNALIIQHYPYDNCIRGRYSEQQKLEEYMQHQFAIDFGDDYRDAVQVAQSHNKPVILLETNTASCNGFLGLSDALSGAIWAVDLSLQLASINFTHVMLHLGGQAAWYNPFMSPPHNATAPFMWTVGPPMYAILFVAEALGKSGTARVADLRPNAANPYTPAYVVYEGENSQPSKVVLINYMSDQTGASAYTARIQHNGPQVWVRYLVAPYISSKRNITWAGQTFGHYFESDGLLRGKHETVIVPCTAGSCGVRVPAPGVALVFLREPAFVPQTNEEMKHTFATTHTTKRYNTAAIPINELQKSNGMNAAQRKKMGGSSTSSGRNHVFDAAVSVRPSVAVLGLAAVCGIAAFLFV